MSASVLFVCKKNGGKSKSGKDLAFDIDAPKLARESLR